MTAEIKLDTKFDKYRYIARVLPPDYSIGCWTCGWEGPTKDASSQRGYPTSRMVEAMGTTQITEVDVFCPSCGHHIISFPKDD